MPGGSEPSAIRRAATSPSPTTPSRTSSARRISRGKIENAGPPRTIRDCGAAARTVSATRAYQPAYVRVYGQAALSALRSESPTVSGRQDSSSARSAARGRR